MRRRGGETRETVATLVASGGPAAGPESDIDLCEADFGRFGLEGVDALRALLAMQPGVPLLVARRTPAQRVQERVIRSLLHRPGNLDDFRDIVQRLRRTGASLYLRLEF
jgi:hypothetical protein